MYQDHERYHQHGPSTDPYDVERRAMRTDDQDRTCGVCEQQNRRCTFGHPSGPCSCWRGIPCRTVPAWVTRAQDRKLPVRVAYATQD